MPTYDEPIPDYLDDDDVFYVEKFRNWCKSGSFNDYDGTGHPVKDGRMMGDFTVKPSRVDEIPADATHVAWFNR